MIASTFFFQIAEEDQTMIIDTVGENAANNQLMVSSIDGNVEQVDAPDTNPVSGPRIRISGALGGMLRLANKEKAAEDKNKESDVVEEISQPITVIGDNNQNKDNQNSRQEPLKNTEGATEENGIPDDEEDEGKLYLLTRITFCMHFFYL